MAEDREQRSAPSAGGAGNAGEGAGDSGSGSVERRRTFGWRAGLLLGVVVLVVVYAIAELTAAVGPLKDIIEHQPVTIAVLVVGTSAVLLSLLPRPHHG